MDQAIRFGGRILFLSSSAEAMRRQLGGEDLTLGDCLPLRDSVSTAVTPDVSGLDAAGAAAAPGSAPPPAARASASRPVPAGRARAAVRGTEAPEMRGRSD